jgi:hypothetical protein
MHTLTNQTSRSGVECRDPEMETWGTVRRGTQAPTLGTSRAGAREGAPSITHFLKPSGLDEHDGTMIGARICTAAVEW